MDTRNYGKQDPRCRQRFQEGGAVDDAVSAPPVPIDPKLMGQGLAAAASFKPVESAPRPEDVGPTATAPAFEQTGPSRAQVGLPKGAKFRRPAGE
jgi:hypothetical protein